MESSSSRTGEAIITEVLRKSEPRPAASDPPTVKNQYAVRFADAVASEFQRDLSGRMKGIEATAKRSAGAVRGLKQLDLNFSTPASGLLLGISLKSVHIREATGAKRYTHNMKRNEEELRIEASGYHKRQPYAVMIAVLFLPFDACTDGRKDNPSSFGSWVRHLRPYAGRVGVNEDEDRFERIFVALYEPDGSEIRFFDVSMAPPKNGVPPSNGALYSVDGVVRRTLDYSEFLDSVYHDYLHRNVAEFLWADGTEDPLASVSEPEVESDED